MRVVLLTNGLGYGGAERIVEALADDLRGAGDAVRVVATTRGGPIGDALRRRGHSVDVLGIRGPWDLRVVRRLRAILRAHRAEVLHSHLAVSDIGAALATSAGGPRPWTVSTVHNPGVELGPLRRAGWGPALRRLGCVLAVSEAARKGLPRGVRAEVVHPSLVDLDRPDLPRAEARRQLGLPVEAPVALAIGRLAPVKGFDVLAAARPLLRTPGAVIAIVGEGPERDRLADAGLRLLGPHPDAGTLVTAADVVVLPSRSEGFPQVPLHAMAARVPVVATRVGGTPEVVGDDETGLLIPPDDPGALARALDALLGDPDRARRLGEAGRARVETRGWTRAGMLEATRRAYVRGQVLGLRKRAPEDEPLKASPPKAHDE